jgi:hypothetical protein
VNYVLVAILGPFAVALGTVIQIQVAGRQRRLEKVQDWARQDELHARDEAVRLADKAEVNGQLKVIHKLVNSNMTAALKAEYDATLRELVLMRELGRPAAAIELVEAKLDEQRAVLADRQRQTEAAEAANKEET